MNDKNIKLIINSKTETYNKKNPIRNWQPLIFIQGGLGGKTFSI